MGRAEDRKKKKYIKKRLTPEQFQRLQSDCNMEYVESEVQKRMEYNKKLFAEALDEAFKRQNIPSSKVKAVIDDMCLIMKRKVEERKNERKS